jgi:hypothetical protein
MWERESIQQTKHPTLKPGWSGGGEEEGAPGGHTVYASYDYPDRKE